MRFKLDISMDDDAMTENPAVELDCVLSGLAKRLARGDIGEGSVWKLYDTNGNSIGKAEVTR